MQFSEILKYLGVKYVPYTPKRPNDPDILEASWYFLTQFPLELISKINQAGPLFLITFYLSFITPINTAKVVAALGEKAAQRKALEVDETETQDIPHNNNDVVDTLNNFLSTTTFETDTKPHEKTQPEIKLNGALTNVTEELLAWINSTRTTDSFKATASAIHQGLISLNEHFDFNVDTLDEDRQRLLVNLIQEKIISQNSKEKITASDIELAFKMIKEQFIKTTIDESKLYWPGDFVIAPTGQITEIPNKSMLAYPGKILLLHRDELSKPESMQKIKDYFISETHNDNYKQTAEKIVKCALDDNCFADKNPNINSPDKLAENLMAYMVGEPKYNKSANKDKEQIESFLKQHFPNANKFNDANIKKAVANLSEIIKKRLELINQNPQEFILQARKAVARTSIDENAKFIRQPVISSFKNLSQQEFNQLHINFVANLPHFAAVILPTEPDLNKLTPPRVQESTGLANIRSQMIFISGYKNIEIVSGIFKDLTMFPKPSVYGGIDNGNPNARSRDRSSNLGHAFGQTSIQEIRDLAHGEIAQGYKLVALMGNSENASQLKQAIEMSKVLMVRMEVLANKILQKIPIDKSTSKGLPEKVIRYSHINKDFLNTLKHNDAVEFNEKQEWQNFKKHLKKDFANIQQEPRYLYVKGLASVNFQVGGTVAVVDPLQNINVKAKIEEIGQIKDQHVYLGVRLPDITDPEQIAAYVLRELAENIQTTVLAMEGAPYTYDMSLETLGRVGEVYGKFKSCGLLALKYLNPYIEILDNTVKNALVKQFFQNIDNYLQKSPFREELSNLQYALKK